MEEFKIYLYSEGLDNGVEEEASYRGNSIVLLRFQVDHFTPKCILGGGS